MPYRDSACVIWGSSFRIAMRYELDGLGSIPSSARFSTGSRPTVGPTRPLIQLVPVVLPPRLKWRECEADRTPPSSIKVKKRDGPIPPLLHGYGASWHSAYVIKHSDSFTFFYHLSVKYILRFFVLFFIRLYSHYLPEQDENIYKYLIFRKLGHSVTQLISGISVISLC